MTSEQKTLVLKELRTIPGVGKEISEDLWRIGIRKVSDLKNKNPEELYKTMCFEQRQEIDRCMLYVLRCAVYYSKTKHPKPSLLLWWNWKDHGVARKK